ncbi:Uncharacterised protein [Yersinia nurmii]|uniref:Lipoprotein n=1 Tax=Yersinia nurmii TaxID=685706 RepID=A0ABM9SLT3_9GAMM|nr:Uncharacterised protein [Yersinia nurmii]
MKRLFLTSWLTLFAMPGLAKSQNGSIFVSLKLYAACQISPETSDTPYGANPQVNCPKDAGYAPKITRSETVTLRKNEVINDVQLPVQLMTLEW